MLGRPSGGLLGPPRPYHKVRNFFSSRLVRSKVDFTPSEALSRAISVLKILEFFREVSFLFDRSLLAKASAREIPLRQSLWPELRVQEHDLPLGAPFLCQGNRHTKKLAHKVFTALASWQKRASPRKPGPENFVCPSVSFGFSTKRRHTKNWHTKFFFGPLVVKKTAVEKLCVPVLAQETPEKDTRIRNYPTWDGLLKHPSECRCRPSIDPTIGRTNVVLKWILPQDELTLSRRPFKETFVLTKRFTHPGKTLL